jgi:hypothetical protein
MEEKRLALSEVLQCFRFREKRGRGSACFGRGKEHVGWLLIPALRGDRRMQRRDGGEQLESGGVWIDLRWKTTSRASWVERLFGSNTVMEIKYAAKVEWAGKERFLG